MRFVCSLVLDSAVVLEFLQMLPPDRHGRLMFPKRLLADCAGLSGKSRCGGAGALGHFFRIEQLAAAPKLTGTPVKLNERWHQSLDSALVISAETCSAQCALPTASHSCRPGIHTSGSRNASPLARCRSSFAAYRTRYSAAFQNSDCGPLQKFDRSDISINEEQLATKIERAETGFKSQCG